MTIMDGIFHSLHMIYGRYWRNWYTVYSIQILKVDPLQYLLGLNSSLKSHEWIESRWKKNRKNVNKCYIYNKLHHPWYSLLLLWTVHSWMIYIILSIAWPNTYRDGFYSESLTSRKDSPTEFCVSYWLHIIQAH